MVGEYWDWEEKHSKANILPNGLEREHGNGLSDVDDKVVINPNKKTIKGNAETVSGNSVAGGSVSRIHSHVNISSFGDNLPGIQYDIPGHKDNLPQYYNVVVTRTHVSFYNARNANGSNKPLIVISRSKFKR